MVNTEVDKERLENLINRIERLEEEKKGIAEDIKEVYGEAKAVGYDVKAMRRAIKLRGMDESKRQEESQLTETYCRALGIQDGVIL